MPPCSQHGCGVGPAAVAGQRPPHAGAGRSDVMNYELQVYALSPVRPTPRELIARAGESGLELEVVGLPGIAPVGADDDTWDALGLSLRED